MEIERKFLLKKAPENLSELSYHKIEQAYLNTNPVVRIRQQDDDYILTYKSGGLMAREEYNLPLNKSSYEHLREKADGIILSKTRYLMPLPGDLTAEIDIFEAPYEGLMILEVEFPTEDDANAFVAPEWFGEEVTWSSAYHNSTLSFGKCKM